MKKISFVHCGDLHLGCQQANPVRWQDFGKAFQQIVDYALEKQVDFCLIAGDLFHHRSVNAPTLAQALEQLARLKEAGIETIAIEGNHDKAFYLDRDSWMNFLQQQGFLKLLKPAFDSEGRLLLTPYDGEKGCVLEAKGVRFVGLGYLGATTRQRLEEIAAGFAPAEGFTVVLLHAAVDKLLGQDLAGVKREVLEKFIGKVDYFALGHLHSRQELWDLVFNPGAPECVHLDEAKEGNEKGFYHVVVEGKDKQVTFIPSRRREVLRLAVDLTGVQAPEEVAPRVLAQLGDLKIQGQPIIQVNLYGTVGFNSFALDLNALAETVRERYNCLSVEIMNNVNLPRLSSPLDFSGFDRLAIERHVLAQMLLEDKPELKGLEERWVETILQVKNGTLAGAPEGEIIATLAQLLDELSLEESASAQEEGGAAVEN